MLITEKLNGWLYRGLKLLIYEHNHVQQFYCRLDGIRGLFAEGKVKEYSTPLGALIFSCGKKNCNVEITKTLVNLWGNS